VTCDKEIDDKRQLRYYKDVTNPNLKNQKHLFIIARFIIARLRKNNIAKIRMNL